MIKRLPMVGIGLPFLLSALTASFLSSDTNIAIIALLCIICVAVLICLAVKRIQAISLIITLIACIAGFLGIYLKTNLEQNKVLPLANNQYIASGLVTDTFINDKGTHGYKVTIDNITNQPSTPKFKTILYSKADLEVEPYSYITADITFNELTNTSGFDMKSYYKQDEIYLLGFVDGSLHNKLDEQNHIGYRFVMLNHLLKQKIDSYFTEDSASLLKSILLGDRSDMSNSLAHNLQLTGILHITAISGLHTGIVAGAILWILKRLRLTLSTCHIMTIIGVWVFIALTGFNISAIRAGIMISIMLAGKLFGRKANSLNSLFLAGIIIVLQNPFAILHLGFMMSFLATLGIILSYKKIYSALQIYFNTQNPILLMIFKPVACTISSTLFLMPVYLIYFDGFSIISLVANIVAVPLGTIILITGLLFLCFSMTPIDIITELVYIIVQMFANTLLLVSDILAQAPFAFLGINELWLKLMIVAFMIIIFIIYKRENKLVKPTLLVISNILIISLLANVFFTMDTIKIKTISSYSGQAVVLTYRRNATVISLNSDSYINKSIVDYLDKNNISNINDYILLEPSTKTVSDIKYLTKYKNIDNYILDNNNQAKLFIERYYKDKITVHSIETLEQTKLFGGIKANVIYDEQGSAIQLDINGNYICIAPNSELITSFEEESDIIFTANEKFTNISEENTHQNEKFNAECVIIIGECDNTHESAQITNFVCTMNNPILLKIRENGEYILTKEV